MPMPTHRDRCWPLFSSLYLTRQKLPFSILVLEADLPLVRSYVAFREMREDVVQSARIPGMYIEGLSLAAMGGEPYSVWD